MTIIDWIIWTTGLCTLLAISVLGVLCLTDWLRRIWNRLTFWYYGKERVEELYKFREDCEVLESLQTPFESSVTKMTITIGNVVIHYENTYDMNKFKGMEYSDIIFDDNLNIAEEDRTLLLSRKRSVK